MTGAEPLVNVPPAGQIGTATERNGRKKRAIPARLGVLLIAGARILRTIEDQQGTDAGTRDGV